MTGAGNKRLHNQLDNAPASLPDNSMAPPVRAKRQRLNKVSSKHLLIFYILDAKHLDHE